MVSGRFISERASRVERPDGGAGDAELDGDAAPGTPRGAGDQRDPACQRFCHVRFTPCLRAKRLPRNYRIWISQ
jgi:hypothetical protein